MKSPTASKKHCSRLFLLLASASAALVGSVGGCRFTSCETTRTCGEGAALGGAGGENLSTTGQGSGSSSGEGGFGGAAPSGGAASSVGSEECNLDAIICDEECVEPLFNNDHCGASSTCRGDNAGDRCLGDEVCSEGVCSNECSGDRLNCEGSCVDPLTDERFCGATGTCAGKAESGLVCDAEEACILGQCRGWTAATHATAVSPTSGLRSAVSLAVNSSGEAVLTWQNFIGGGSREEVFTSHFVDSTWSQATLRNSEDVKCLFPSVAVEGTRFHLAWIEEPSTMGGFPRVYVDRWEEDVWAGPVQVSPSSVLSAFFGTSFETSLAVDRAGNRFLVWKVGRIIGSILTKVWDPQAMAWSELDALGGNFEITSSPVVAAIGDSQGLLLWNEEVDEVLVLRGCQISAASPCDATTIHSDEDGEVGAPLLAGSEAGNAVAAWIAGGGSNGPIWAIAYDSGNWRDVKSLGSGMSPRLAFGGSGYAAVAFRESSEISVVLRTSGSKWGNKVSFPADLRSSNPQGPDIAIDGEGNVLLAWIVEVKNENDVKVFVSRFDRDDGRWNDPVLVATAESQVSDLRLGVTAEGLGLLTYWVAGKLHFAEFR